MSADYQIKFYQPNRRLDRAEVVRAVQVFLDRQYKILRFRQGITFVRASDNLAAAANDAVDANGECLMRLVCDPAAGRWPVVFQAYPPEVKDAQATLSIEDGIYAEDPERLGRVMLNLAGPLLEALGALFAWSDHEEMLRKLEKKLAFDHVGALAWGNLFSRQFAGQLGEERLKTTPAHQLVELKPGWLVVTVADPTRPTPKEIAERIAGHWPGCQVREQTA